MATRVAQPAETAIPQGPAPPPSGDSARLLSLDAFRGFIMFWLVGGAGILEAMVDLWPNPVTRFLHYEFNHSEWIGLRFWDLIWPSFMLMVGVSVAFSFAKRSAGSSHRQWILHAIRRAIILFLLGSLRTSLHYGSPLWVELSSALQPIAAAYLVAALIADRSPRFQALTGGAILAGYALLLAFVPAPGIPAGNYVRNSNLVTAVDLAVLGRYHPGGWGTVLSTITTISTTILGLLLGGLLKSGASQRRKMSIIALTGIGGFAIGWALHPVVPMIMKLWTTSYGIASAGCSCLLFLLFYWLIDVRGYRKWAFPFVVVGMNALAIYMGKALVPIHHEVEVVTKGVVAQIGPWGPLFNAVCIMAVEWLILYWMYRRKLFLRP